VDNKPYLALDSRDHVYVSDPMDGQVLEFARGEMVRLWGENEADISKFGQPVGLAFDGQGSLWVSDAGGHRIVRFAVGNP